VVALLLASSSGRRRRFGNNRSSSRLDLLKEIVQSTNGDSNSDSNNILGRIGNRRPTSILDRVRNRPNVSPLEPKKSSNNRRPFSPKITQGNLRNSLSDNECEELKNENDILKQLVESVNRKRAEEAKAEINNRAINQAQLSQVNQPNPLSILSEALKLSLGLAPTPSLPLAIPGVHDRGIRRVNTLPETSTVLQTTSYETHLTSQVTKDISLRFQGKWKTTKVVDTIIETSTITEVLTTLITATKPAAVLKQINTVDHNDRHQKQRERPRSNNRFRPNLPKRSQQVNIKPFKPQRPQIKPFKPERPQLNRPTSRSQSLDSFESLKSYLKSIKQKHAVGPTESPSLLRPRKYTVDRSEDTPVSRRAGLFGSTDLLKEQILNPVRKLVETNNPPTTTPSPPPEPQPLPPPNPQELPPPKPQPVPPPEQPQATSEATASNDQVVAITSISTIFISGKVPGVYTTSLKTIIVKSASPREKRHAEGLIRPTKTITLDRDATEHHHWDLMIESSFEEAAKPECGQHTVTVTVVETVGCQV